MTIVDEHGDVGKEKLGLGNEEREQRDWQVMPSGLGRYSTRQPGILADRTHFAKLRRGIY